MFATSFLLLASKSMQMQLQSGMVVTLGKAICRCEYSINLSQSGEGSSCAGAWRTAVAAAFTFFLPAPCKRHVDSASACSAVRWAVLRAQSALHPPTVCSTQRVLPQQLTAAQLVSCDTLNLTNLTAAALCILLAS
jgi:hypothetical protein